VHGIAVKAAFRLAIFVSLEQPRSTPKGAEPSLALETLAVKRTGLADIAESSTIWKPAACCAFTRLLARNP